MDPLAPAAALARIDAGPLAALVTRLRGMSQQLRSAAECLAAAPALLPGWTGAGSDGFARAAAAARGRLTGMGDALDAAASALCSLTAALRVVQDEVTAARRVLAAAGPSDPSPAIASQLTGAAATFRDADLRAAALLAEALLLDLTHGSALPAGARVSAQLGAGSLAQDLSAAPPLPASAPAVAVWWAGLTPAARSATASGWPGLAGGIDGIPAGVRDAVNRRLLAAAVQDAQRAYARSPEYETYAHLSARARLLRLQALAAAVRPPGTQLLLFDPNGDGEAVVSTADVQSSRSVAVMVPGMSNELADVPALTRDARRLAAAAGPGAAVVAWLGYDAPDVHQVASDGRARSGSWALQRFIAGLRSTAARVQHVTVLGHSYGSLVAGLAAKRGLAADDLVLLASPGVEASRASQLRLPAGHVWAARAPTDPIQLVFWPQRLGRLFGIELPPVFGPDPAAAAFGARHFPDAGAYGHSGYLAAGSQSLASLAGIVSARPVR